MLDARDNPHAAYLRVLRGREAAARGAGSGVSPEDRARYDWPRIARPSQLPPPGPWTYWLTQAGRGYGKTRMLAETARMWAEQMPGSWGMIVAATSGDLSSVVLNGESGLRTISPPWFRPELRQSEGEGTFLRWPNGTRAYVRSAEEPNRCAGPQFTWLVGDEFALWRTKSGEHAWSMLKLGLRLPGPNGEAPRAALAGTPRPVEHLRKLRADPACVTTRGTTYDNRANLAGSFFASVVTDFEGTRLGSRELLGEDLADVEGALLRWEHFDFARIAVAPALVRVVVAVDPAVTAHEDSDETGIIVAGIDRGRESYVLADLSGRYSVDTWGRRAVLAYDEHEADAILGEVNNGGDLVESNVRQAAAALHREGKRASPHVTIKQVRAGRAGKGLRAGPIAGLYEQGRVHHVGPMPRLEEQWATWVPGDSDRWHEGAERGWRWKSPDRVDAGVWALSDLMLGAGIIDVAKLASAQEQFRALGPSPDRHRYG